MQDQFTSEDGEGQDDRLRQLLRAWSAPDPQPSLDARIVAGFRAYQPVASPSKRFWTASVSVPVPVVGLVVGLAALALITSAVLLWRGPGRVTPHPASLESVGPIPFGGPEQDVPTRQGPPSGRKPVSAPPLRQPRGVGAGTKLRSKASQPSTIAVYWTELDLTGFMPTKQITVSIIRRKSPNEQQN